MRRRATGIRYVGLVALATIANGFGIGLVGGVLGKVVHSRMADLSDS